MVTFASQRIPPLVNQDRDWGPAVVSPLDERTAYRVLDRYLEREALKQAIAEFARIDDEEALSKLVDCGFTPATLPALHFAPIAFVTWACTSVTHRKQQAAVRSIRNTRLHRFPEAMARFRSWLDVRPEQQLWDVWSDFTRCRLEMTPRSVRNETGYQLIRQATSVALASGNRQGIGNVNAAERAIIEGIRHMYQI